MNNNDDHKQDPLDANLAKLIRQDSLPPAPSEDQKQAMFARLRQKQEELAQPAPVAPARPRRPRIVHPLFLGGLAAAALIAFGLIYLLPSEGTGGPKVADEQLAPESPPSNLEKHLGPEIDPPIPPTPVPKEEVFAAVTYDVKDSTERIALRDGSTAIAKAGTRFTETGLRQLDLHEGSLYLLVSKDDTPLEVQTVNGKARALGTRFLISSDPEDTRVAVAQGHVQLVRNNLEHLELRRGEEGIFGPDELVLRPAPRVSHLLDWAREVLKQPDPIVDKERPAGLIAVDPQGQETRLSLRNYTLDVVIEDGVARTTIDQTFFNHYHANTEGTFYFPLPPGATVSRMAMYVFGKRNEAGMVERKRGQQIYNDIKYENRDPALLEQLEGNLYKLRIFPLEGRQEKRIFISFTQTLDELYHTLRYWFPMEHTHNTTGELDIKIRVKNGAHQFDPQSNTHRFESQHDEGDLILRYHAKDVAPDQDVLLQLTPKQKKIHADTATLQRDGINYLQTRFRPQLKGKVDPKARQWFVLNDISASRTDAELRAQIHILRRLLAEGDDDDQFALANLSVDLQRISALVPLRGQEAEKAVAAAGKVRRLGGTNLENGITNVLKWIKESGAQNPHVIYLGDALPSDGETTQRALRSLLDPKVPFIGIAVGKKADLSLLQAAADATSGAAFLMNPKEDLNWRVLDMLASFNTPRLTNLHWEFVGAEGDITAYSNRSTLSAGELLTLVASTKKELPKQLTIRGNLQGQPWQQTIDLSPRRKDAGYLPRFFAQKHIESLLQDGETHREEVVKLSMKHYVATPFTSLIVLENDKMYQEYNVEKGRKDHWAAYPAPDEIPVVREPMRWAPSHWNLTNKDHEITIDPKTPEEILKTILPQTAPNALPPNILRRWDETDTTIFVNGLDANNLWFDSVPILGDVPVLGGLFRTDSPIDRFVRSEWTTNGIDARDFYANNVFFSQIRGDLNGDLLLGVTPSSIVQPHHWGFISPNQQLTRRLSLDLTGRPVRFRGGEVNGLTLGTGLITGTNLFMDIDGDGDGLTHFNEFYLRPNVGGFGPVFEAPLLAHLATRIPGLQTMSSDAASLVEMKHGREKRGSIAADAATLLRAAEAKRKSVRLDGTIVTPDGRMKTTRTTPFFLNEELISDGKDWYHIYRELGFATRRPVTPTNRARIQGLVAHWPPSVNELEAHWKVTLLERNDTSFKVSLVNPDKADHKLLLTIDSEGRLLASERSEDGELVVSFTYRYEGDSVTIESHTGQLQSYEAVEIEVADALFNVKLEEVVLDLPLRKPTFYTKQLAALGKDEIEKRKSLLRHRIVSYRLDPRYHISVHQANVNQDWGLLIQLNAGKSPLFDHRTLTAVINTKSLPVGVENRFLAHLRALSKFQFNSVPGRADVEEFLKNWPDSPFALTLARACLDSQVWIPLLDHDKYRAIAIRSIAHAHDVDKYDPKGKTEQQKLDRLIALNTAQANLNKLRATHDENHPLVLEQLELIKELEKQKDLSALNAAQEKLAELRITHTDDHPLVIEQLAKIKPLKQIATVRVRVANLLMASAKEGKPIRLDKMIARFVGRDKEPDASFWPEISKAYRTLGTNLHPLDDRVISVLLDFALLDNDQELAKRCTAHLRDGIGENKRPDLFVSLARLFARHDQKKQAINYYEIALKASPKADANLLQEASGVAKDIDDLKAIDWQHKALRVLGEENVAANAQLLAQSYLDLITRSLSADDIERAITLALEAYDFMPEHHSFLTKIASYYHEKENETERWRWLSTILDRHPKNAVAFGAVADWFSEHEMLDQADSFFAKAHSFDSAHPQWMKKRINVLYRAGKWNEADALYKELRKTDWADQLKREVPRQFRIPLFSKDRLGKVTTEDPGEDWNQINYDDQTWNERSLRFMSTEEDHKILEDTIHARQVFTLKDKPRGLELSAGVHGVECDVYLNGKLVRRLEQKGANPATADKTYSLPLSKEIVDALQVGENVVSYRAKKIGKNPRVRVDLIQVFKPID